MKRCILLAVLTSCCIPVLAAELPEKQKAELPNKENAKSPEKEKAESPRKEKAGLTKKEKDEGFKLLFDGKSFEGWRVNEGTPKSWKIENGLLVLTGGNSHLFTEKQFDDFIVRFEWRPAKKGYNSGFFIRGRSQIQMAQGGAGMLFGSKEAKAVPKLHRPPGEWNQWEVTCIGPKVALRVNGKPAWEIDNFKPVRGPLGIEAEGHPIEFRNLRIKTVRKETDNTSEYRERLVAEKKYPEALEAYKDALAKDPKNPVLMYNAGLMAYLCEEPKEAAEFWSREKAIEPDNWRVRAKLVQAHEAAGNFKERDAEREDLFKLRKESADKELKNLEHYCRDQFSVGKNRVMVFEYFELKGDWAVRLSFLVRESDRQDVQSRYTLGSYRHTNEIAKEMKQIRPDQRLFHLDGYFNGGRSHRTYEFFLGEPKYDAVKAAVKQILEGKRKPISGTDASAGEQRAAQPGWLCAAARALG